MDTYARGFVAQRMQKVVPESESTRIDFATTNTQSPSLADIREESP